VLSESLQRTIPGNSGMMEAQIVTSSTQTARHHIKAKINVTPSPLDENGAHQIASLP
jgi:hypothetical protein